MATRPRRDLSNLPAAAAKPVRPPSKNPIVVNEIAEAWHRQYLSSGDDDYAPAIAGSRYRASWAGQRCDRQTFYAMTGEPRTVPLSMSSAWRMKLGNLVHDELDEVMHALGNGWRSEIVVDLAPLGVPGSAHADLVRFVCVRCDDPIAMIEIVDSDSTGWQQWACVCSTGCPDSVSFEIERTAAGEHTWDAAHEKAADVCEFKTQGGYSFKMTSTPQGGGPEGPRFGHVLQGGMCADALDCDRITIAYIAFENVSVGQAERMGLSDVERFTSEWHFSRQQLRALLDSEYARIRRLLSHVDNSARPAAALFDEGYPIGAVLVDPTRNRWELVDPMTGRIEQFGQHPFICDYCDWRPTCIEHGPDAQSTVGEVV